jgi:hypothetical protein
LKTGGSTLNKTGGVVLEPYKMGGAVLEPCKVGGAALGPCKVGGAALEGDGTRDLMASGRVGLGDSNGVGVMMLGPLVLEEIAFEKMNPGS